MLRRAVTSRSCWSRVLQFKSLCTQNEQVTSEVTDLPPHNWFLEEPYRVSVIGVPTNSGQPKHGTEKGPALMRGGKQTLEERVRSLGWHVRDEGDIEVDGVTETPDPVSNYGMKRSRTNALVNKLLHEKVYQNAREGRFVLTLGGDHSIAIGSISGMLRHRPDTCVVWVDAHADINTETTSPSGNIHGMPVGFLSRLVQMANCPGWEWFNQEEPVTVRENGKERISTRYRIPTLRPEKIVYIGLRDVDPGEKAILKRLGIRAFSMYEIDRHNIGPVVEMALRAVDPQAKSPIHLSFDIDALDPAVAPTTGTPVVGGLTFREGAYLCEVLASTSRLCSMDMVEVNPDLAAHSKDAEQTVDMAKRMIACALGETLLWGDERSRIPTYLSYPR